MIRPAVCLLAAASLLLALLPTAEAESGARRLIETLHESRVEELYYRDARFPRNVRELIGQSGNTAELISAFDRDISDPMFRFNIVMILNRKSAADPAERGAIAEALARALKDEHPWVRTEAVWGLGRIGKPDRLPSIIALLDDPDESVVNETLHALTALTGGRNEGVSNQKMQATERREAVQHWRRWWAERGGAAASSTASINYSRLHGTWQFSDERATTTMTFTPAGRFHGVLVHADGSREWKFGGRWWHEGDKLHYEYQQSSDPRIPSGLRDRDEIKAVTDGDLDLICASGARKVYRRLATTAEEPVFAPSALPADSSAPAPSAPAAPAGVKDCAELQREIAEKLDAKGVRRYVLTVLSADATSELQTVGTCAAGRRKIVYERR